MCECGLTYVLMAITALVSNFRMKLSAHWVGGAGLASRQWG
jgi:hypothetical protein